ncbi:MULTISPECIES: tetratricopeptide repeat protein [unclassified Marinobacter]|uniref:tetratricopeptide repeat protein n=1 Tax=unclassified Marinobacter TaxID=83889 RepID=UPI001268F7E8|nr:MULTISPECIES: tetratricopeptide repeat protein [unclassified Marinobacter]
MKKLSCHSVMVSTAFCVLLALTWFVYQPGLSGPFFLDDFDNLSALEGGVESVGDLNHYLSIGNAGPLGRPVAKLSFLLDDNNWPSNPEDFKKTNLLIHLLVGIIGFIALRVLGRQLLKDSSANWIALAATAIWLVHPMQVSTVLYVVQRMTQLSALFSLLGIAAHLFLRMRYPEPRIFQLALLSGSLGLFTLLAILSKESGALLPVYILVIEATILASKKQSALFLWWKRISLVAPTTFILIYVLYFPKWVGSYANRDFTLQERLLTQSVVLWDYIESLFDLQVHQLGLFQDDYPIYSSLWVPEVFFSVLGIVLFVGFAVMFRRSYPVLSFGILWFFAGHIIESSAVPLELYFEHRNYLPFFGPMFAFVCILSNALGKYVKAVPRFEAVVFAMIITVAAGVTWGYSSEWGDSRRIIPIWSSEHPNSLRAQRTFAQHLASVGFPDAALDVIDETYKAFPHDLSLPLMSLTFSCAFEKPIRYDLAEIAQNFAQHRWTDGLRPVVSNLSRFIHETSCSTIAPDVADLLKGTLAFEGQGTNTSGVAAFQAIAGDLMLGSGNADAALEFYFKVDNMLPSVDSATRIAHVYLRAGEFPSARRMLEVAIERDAQDGISEEKMAQYITIFEFIDERINSNLP